jgi:hypothetical protein
MGNNKKQRKASKSPNKKQRDAKVSGISEAPKNVGDIHSLEAPSEKITTQSDVKKEEGSSPPLRREVKAWRRKLLLEGRHVGTWGAIFGAITLAVAIVTVIYSYKTSWAIQTRNEELATSKITYAFFISPAPIPGEEDVKTTSRWEVRIMIANAGPATAQNLVLHLRTPDPGILLHSEPRVMTPPATADVKVNKFIPDGIYQVVFKNFGAGDTCYINMFYRTPEDKSREFQEKWSPFDEEFGRRFIQEFFFTGDRLKVENFGALKLKPSSGDFVE